MSRRRLRASSARSALAVLAGLGATGLAVVVSAPGALATAIPVGPTSQPIGPDQYFGAKIDGSTGHVTPVTIRMACGGPVTPDETGHPVAGQSISVLPAPSAGSQWGYTGSTGHSVTAWFGAPPPSPGATTAPTTNVTFDDYGTRPLPTSLVLPCGGTGNVTFLTAPLGGDRSFTVPVVYVSLAVTPG